MRAWVACFAAVAAAVALSVPGGAYTFTGQSWATGSTVTMHMQLGASSQSLIDGATTWNQVGENALAAWNSRANIAFGIIRNSSSGIALRNGVNNAYFASTSAGGDSFGEGVLAVATSLASSSGRTSEVDVAFNTSYSWNSYRGNRRTGIIDVYRVAVHEFGHVLGLDHPDQAGQSRTAIMNSTIGNTDDIQSDDINGLLAIYGTAQAANRTPSVTASCSPCTIGTGGAVTLSARASDPDGDSLSYAWSVSGGTVANSGSSSTT